jgi:hypothetical protein
MKTFIQLVVFFAGSALGFPFGWWLRGRGLKEQMRRLTGELRSHEERLAQAVRENRSSVISGLGTGISKPKTKGK